MTITPVVATAVKYRPRTAVGRRSLVLTQQRSVFIDAAASHVTGRRPGTGNGSGHRRNDLDVTEVVGATRCRAVSIAFWCRADALQFTCFIHKRHIRPIIPGT